MYKIRKEQGHIRIDLISNKKVTTTKVKVIKDNVITKENSKIIYY